MERRDISVVFWIPRQPLVYPLVMKPELYIDFLRDLFNQNIFKSPRYLSDFVDVDYFVENRTKFHFYWVSVVSFKEGLNIVFEKGKTKILEPCLRSDIRIVVVRFKELLFQSLCWTCFLPICLKK